MNVIKKHWQGKLPLPVSLWLIFVGLLLLISYFEVGLLKRFFSNSEKLIPATIVSLLVTRFIIFPWQLFGLLRATEKDYIDHGNTIKTRCIQALMVFSVLFTLVYISESLQTVFQYKEKKASQLDTKSSPSYLLNIRNNQLHIKGVFDFGITQSVQKLIAKNPNLTSVVLESIGGQVYEGRGLSRLFTQHNLDTYVYFECSSACATAFIGGKNRYLSSQARIGFHRYKLENMNKWNVLPYFDIESEQQKDLALFKSQGIKPLILEQIFNQATDEIWFPTQHQLKQAEVIHHLVEPEK